MAPKISALIPAYNRPQLLREALSSALNQSDACFSEIIVTDDLGMPETIRVISECTDWAEGAYPEVTYTRNPRHLGGVASWNRGLSLATGDWITLLHEDDVLLPDFLRTVQPHLNDGIAAIAVRCMQGLSLSAAKVPRSSGAVRSYPSQYFLKSAMTPFPGVVLSRACVQALGGFDPAWGPLADYEFWYRVSQYGEIVFIDHPGAFYRVSEGQWTARVWPQMLRRTLQLRRQIAREQFPEYPRWGKWVARFFTLRNGRSYFRRYGTGAANSEPTSSGAPAARVIAQFRQLQRMPFHWLPSGWVWASVRLMTWWTRHARSDVGPKRSAFVRTQGKESHA